MFVFIVLGVLIIGVIAFIIIVHRFKNRNIQNSRYFPFAYLPELNISQQPQFLARNLQNKLLNQKMVDPDQNMVMGRYQRFPLNQSIQTTSVVAVEPSIDVFPFYTAWDIEVDIDAWNFVWADSQSSYFITAVNLTSTPVVVVKGEFPLCRYMSIYSYLGPERTKKGDKLFGQGSTQDGKNRCSASEQEGPNACAGFRDFNIVPDRGSKNPFSDATYRDGDPKFYTLYFKSPYYKGQLPKDAKNVAPLAIYGASTALIVYRIYSTFNPKNCTSQWYWSRTYFDTKGCENKPKTQRFVDSPTTGGAVFPIFDKSAPSCRLGDSVCYNQCIAEKLGQSKVSECHQYVGNNLYCVCDYPDDPCYAEINRIVGECTNGFGDIDNFCAKAPDRAVSNCLNDIQCSPDDKACNDYVNRSEFQQCSAERLLETATDDKCSIYNNPNKVCELCPPRKPDGTLDRATITKQMNDPTTCQYKLNQSLQYCTQQDIPGWSKFDLTGFCNTRCNPDFPGTNEPPLAYQPVYDFDTVPSCDFNCSAPQGENPSQCKSSDKKGLGQYIGDQCGGDCAAQKLLPTGPPDENQPTSAPVRRRPTRDRGSIESFTATTGAPDQDTSSCIFDPRNPKRCDYNAKEWKDIARFGLNSKPAAKIFRQGWVDLPSVFLKYNYTDYFIRLNTWTFQRLYKLSLLKVLEPVIIPALRKEPVRPNDFNRIGLLQTNTIGLQKTEEGSIREDFDVNNLTDSFGSLENCLQETTGTTGDSEGLFECVAKNITGDAENNNLPPIGKTARTKACAEYVDPSTYFYSGAQWPLESILHPSEPTTSKAEPPFCNFYQEQCRCINNSKKQNNCCESALGNLTCEGKPCFVQWSTSGQKFDGVAKQFVYSGDTGNVIPFPNPDISYIGCCTSYDPDNIYVIWMDMPSFPHTPGFQNIQKKDYDLRYCSIGHYYWNMDPKNQRPSQSDLVDAELKTPQVQYYPEKFDQNTTIKGRRACIVLATYEQLEFLKKIGVWDDKRLNWLNWGKLPQVPKNKNFSDVDLSPDELVNRIKNAVDNRDSESADMFRRLLDQKQKDQKTDKHIPAKGILLMRQLFPSSDFKEALTLFQNSKEYPCVKSTVKVSDAYRTMNQLAPMEYPKFCNPGTATINKYASPDMTTKFGSDGTTPVCQAYGFDPCCLCRDVLYHMKQYYPRCEMLRLCDLRGKDQSYWDRYFGSLPFDFGRNDDSSSNE